jgi:3-oxoacyl-[acyl-carrier protein] reductase
MDLGIRGKVALVVGSSKNIGLAVTKALYDEGCVIVKCSRSDGYDLMPDGAPQRFCQTLAEHSITPDIIVHAIGGSNGTTDTWGTADDYANVWRLNVGIPHEINRACVPRMQEKGWGRIVHFSSVAVTANIGFCPYASAKHAVEGYVKNVSKELSPQGVIMSCVRPGAFPYAGRYLHELDADGKAEFIARHIPQGRFGEAAECAHLVAFLCGQGASYMAGAVAAVDGGHR